MNTFVLFGLTPDMLDRRVQLPVLEAGARHLN